MATKHKVTHSFGHMVFARSRDKLKPSYIQYHRAYGQETLQGGDLPKGVPVHKVARLLNHVVLRNRVTNQSHYISASTMTMVN